MKIIRDKKGTTIESPLVASGVDMNCFIGRTGGDNADAVFYLGIPTGGQVQLGCDLDMCGPLERADFLPFLKQIVYEMELLEKEENHIVSDIF
jgi:hypothetical protein